jgi:hypothetical protein
MKIPCKQLLKYSALPLAIFSGHAFADINFNGFASIRATAADSDGGTSPFETLKGDGDISFKDESLFAIQASADLGEGLTATVQLMAEGINEFDVEARWAYLTYEINDTHRVSAGRVANPIFFQSQYEKVGYAHNYARLPKSVYFGLPYSTVEGVSLDSTFFIGDYTLDTKILYGNWDEDGITFAFKDMVTVGATLSGDWWKVFAGYLLTEMESVGSNEIVLGAVQSSGLIDAALLSGASQTEVDAALDRMYIDGKDGVYWYTGFNIDYNNFLIDFEYADYVIEDSVDADNNVWYAAIGYRFDEFVITVHTEDHAQEPDPSLGDGITNPVLNQTISVFQNAFRGTEFDGSGINVRYDFHPSAALKIDYFSGENPNPAVGDYTIWSVGVDLVF